MNTAVSVPVHAICYRGDSNWFSRKFHELLQIQVGEGGTPKHPLGGLVTESDRGSGSAFTAHTSDGHALASPAHQAAACWRRFGRDDKSSAPSTNSAELNRADLILSDRRAGRRQIAAAVNHRIVPDTQIHGTVRIPLPPPAHKN